MPVAEFAIELAAPLDRVWAWHENVRSALPALCPPGDDVRLESAPKHPPIVGDEVIITAKGPLAALGIGGGRMRWVARYVEVVPPHPVAFGAEARFVDEQVTGPFGYWRHSHEFEALSDTTTRLLDRVTYRPPLWPASLPAELLFVRPKLRRMFAHRHRVLREVFG